MSRVEVFLDDTPGEARGVIRRDGRYTDLLIERDDDEPRHRLGARLVGRVAEAAPGLKGVFVDLGTDRTGFLPLKGGNRVDVGRKVEVEVVAEPREAKGPTLRRLGDGEAEVRLLAPAPGVAETLAALAPGIAPVTGANAIRAGEEAADDAISRGAVFPDTGLDLSVERTRALIAVDLDLASAGAGSGKGRDRANRQGLIEAARLIRLKAWGGLVAVDLVGVGHDGAAVAGWAKAAFGADPAVVIGPVNRFGVLQLSLPWGRTPLDERLGGRPELALVRAMRRALLEDTAAPRLTVRCAPAVAAAAAPFMARLGPRAGLCADAAVAPGAEVWEQG